jgi:hypothetical protein
MRTADGLWNVAWIGEEAIVVRHERRAYTHPVGEM